MIGNAMKEKREAMGLTQDGLAGRLFVSQSRVAQVEAGIKLPSVGMVKLAAEVFGCTTDELIYSGERKGSGESA